MAVTTTNAPRGEAGTAARLIPFGAFALGMAAISIPAHLAFSDATGPIFILAKALAGALVGTVCWYLARAYTARVGGASRTALAGALAWIGGIAALVIALESNYVGARHWVRGDWTSTSFYTLSDKSIAVLEELKKPVHVIVFLSPRSEVFADIFGDVQELLSQLQARNPLLTVEYLDPDRNIEKAEVLFKKYRPPEPDVVVFEAGTEPAAKTKFVTPDEMAEYDWSAADPFGGGGGKKLKAFKGEEAFVSAILEVTSDQVTELCFSKGHGERSTTDTGDPDALGILTETLLKVESLKAQDVDLSKSELPATCALLVVAGPETPFLPAETAKIDAFLNKGGKLLALFDPPLDDPTTGPRVKTGFEDLLARWGVTLDRAVALDPVNMLAVPGESGLEAAALGVVDWGEHAIVKPFVAEGLPALFRLTRAVIGMNPPPAGLAVHELMRTSADGWGERGPLVGRDRASPDPDDLKGPVPLGVAVDAPTRGGARLVVFGNSRFAGNLMIGRRVGVNYDLFVNAVRWLTKREKLIALDAKAPEEVTLDLTAGQQNLVFWTSIVILPLLSILVGLTVWRVRRTS